MSESRAAAAVADDRIAIAIARGLIGEDPTADEIARWKRAVEIAALPLASGRDRALWDLIQRSPRMIGPVDAGLAFLDPHSPVRQRLYLMLAVLEASPAHVGRFIAGDEPVGALLGLIPRGIAAAFRSAVGIVLVALHPAAPRRIDRP
ncbi:MAG TPA: hypothetical protein VL123_09140 [Candidatus Udaeobacter sp.]|nr:hypothetical protein [Candidatus Udaeobacter sp.]